MSEPKLIHVTMRDAEDEIHMECRFDDGQKFAAVTVDAGHEQLARAVFDALDEIAETNRAMDGDDRHWVDDADALIALGSAQS